MQTHEAWSTALTSPEDERLLTRGEVEERFGVSRRYLELATGKGNGPIIVRIGRSVRYRPCDVRSWIEQNRVEASADEQT